MKGSCLLIAAALFLSAALAISANAANSPAPANQQKHQTHKHAQETKHRASTTIYPPLLSLVAEAQPNTGPHAQAAYGEPKHWYDRFWPPLFETVFPPVWSNWALVIVAALAAYVAVRTLKAIEHESRIALMNVRVSRNGVNAARRSAEAAQRAAIAAEESNKEARNAAATELRAYLSVARILVITPTLDDPSYRPRPGVLGDLVQVVIKNSGKTPAYKATASANSFVVPARNILPDDFDYPDLSPPSDLNFLIASATLPTESEHVFNCPSAPSPEMLTLIRNGERWLYIYGHVDYLDVFQKPHQTPFCWLYVQGIKSTEYGFATYKDHNTPN